MATEPEVEGSTDPLAGSPTVSSVVGDALERLDQFHRMLSVHGVERGLIGPREPYRLWERHLLNSAAVVPFLADASTIVDLGSGAGLPGIVVAAMLPHAMVTLLEPMERRCLWLTEVVTTLGLSNATVLRGRADEVVGQVAADAVTARAVGAMDRLYRWAGPLLRPGGRLVALKGGRAAEEVEEASRAGAKAGFGTAEVHEVVTVVGAPSTWVVVAQRNGDARGAR